MVTTKRPFTHCPRCAGLLQIDREGVYFCISCGELDHPDRKVAVRPAGEKRRNPRQKWML